MAQEISTASQRRLPHFQHTYRVDALLVEYSARLDDLAQKPQHQNGGSPDCVEEGSQVTRLADLELLVESLSQAK